LRVELLPGEVEQVAAGDPVYLDGQKIGEVTGTQDSPDGTVASCRSDDADAAGQLRVGVMRTHETARSALSSERIQSDALPLREGTVIRVQSQVEYVIDRYATGPTIMALVAIKLILVVVFFLFSSVIKFVRLVFALGLSLVTAVLLYPVGAPWVAKGYT